MFWRFLRDKIEISDFEIEIERSALPVVFFEKAVLKIFQEILRKSFTTEHILNAHN